MHNSCNNGIKTTIDNRGVRLSFCDCELGQSQKYKGVHSAALYWTFDDFPGDKSALEEVQKLLQDDCWIILTGPFGSCKTSLAVYMFKDAVDSIVKKYGEASLITGHVMEKVTLKDGTVYHKPVPLRRPAFWNVEQLLAASKATIGNEDALDPIEVLKRESPLLVLDGLGEVTLSDWDRDAISQLIGQRYNQWRTLRTVITTNWPVAEFKNKLGGWVSSRLGEIARVVIPKERLR